MLIFSQGNAEHVEWVRNVWICFGICQPVRTQSVNSCQLNVIKKLIILVEEINIYNLI